MTKRLQLARAVFQGKQVTVSDLEARLPRPTLTANTLQLVQREHRAVRLALLLGQDQLSGLPDWQRVQEITAACDIIVARREKTAPLANSVQKLATRLNTKLTWDAARQCYATQCFSVYLLATKLLNISSTILRAHCHEQQELQNVPPAVVDFFNNMHRC